MVLSNSAIFVPSGTMAFNANVRAIQFFRPNVPKSTHSVFFYMLKLASSLSNNALRKDILRRICPIELKFSGFVVLSKFCGISIELCHPLHFVEVMHRKVCWIFISVIFLSPFNVFLTFHKSQSLSQEAIRLLFKSVKLILLDQFF